MSDLQPANTLGSTPGDGRLSACAHTERGGGSGYTWERAAIRQACEQQSIRKEQDR